MHIQKNKKFLPIILRIFAVMFVFVSIFAEAFSEAGFYENHTIGVWIILSFFLLMATVIGLLLINIRMRRVVELKIKTTNFLLESEIKERISTEKELIKAKANADAANSAKSVFLANMSHEIRNPLNGILGMTELTLLTPLNPEQRSYLFLAQKSANTLLRIISDILDYSKIEAEKIGVEKGNFAVRETVRDILTMYEISAKRKHIELFVDVAKDVPNVIYGDEVRVRQILSNLIDNAVKFTDKGIIRVLLKVKSKDEKQLCLHFTVQDSGIGIPIEQHSLLFQRFQQLDSTYTKKYQGTGLGLAICKKLVEMFGGNIWVESSVNKGSLFHFTLCFENDFVEDSKIDFSAQGEITQVIEPANVLRKRILIVEDEEVNRILIFEYLEEINFEVIAAVNGEEAVSIFKNQKIDLVLMDIQMPVMDGVAAIKIIKEIQKAKSTNIPVLALTAYTLKEDVNNFLAAGFDDCVSKPVNLNKLVRIMRRYL